jgi:lipopolysaccharide export system permease protein
MTLTWYFFRQFLPSFFFGSFLFMFVLLLDKLFEIIDMIFNKGVNVIVVAKLFALFIPTILPLTLPMALLLACLVTFGRISEENELNAVRAAGISLHRVLWLPPLFALLLSIGLIPFNKEVAPWASRSFQKIYEKIMRADPLLNVEPQKFFELKNIKIFAESIDKESRVLHDVFVFQLSHDGRPAERIFAKNGIIESDEKSFGMKLETGQMERFDQVNPQKLMHTTFAVYHISIPIVLQDGEKVTRFRNLGAADLNRMIDDMKSKNLPASPVEAERSLRVAIAFAPVSLFLIGLPLATVLKRGGKTFGFGVSIVIIFFYYLLLVFGLTLAEKGVLPPTPSLWMGNVICLMLGTWLNIRMLKQ